MDLNKLKKPFPAEDIEWRAQSSGKTAKGPWVLVLAYVTSRAIQDRLDEVCGLNGWQNDFKDSANGGTLCGISIKCGDEWITKWDGAGNTEIEAIKGGYSGAMKRAGSQWGIGRYLYNLPVGFGIIDANGAHKAKTKEGDWFKWNPPQLPAWALPEGTKQQKNPPEARQVAPEPIEGDVPDFPPPPPETGTGEAVTPVQTKGLIGTMTGAGVSAEEFCQQFDLGAVSELAKSKFTDALAWLNKEKENRA